MLGELAGDKIIAEETAALIEQVVGDAVAATLGKINATLEGRTAVAKAEPETNLERIEREREERRDELREIDAQIMLNTSGLIECYLPETSGITKAEADEDNDRWRRSMGLQETIRRPAYEGAR